jgi:hypothetical protein
MLCLSVFLYSYEKYPCEYANDLAFDGRFESVVATVFPRIGNILQTRSFYSLICIRFSLILSVYLLKLTR